MKCEYCKQDFSMGELMFIADGMVPQTHINRHRAQCGECARKKPIDNKPPEPIDKAPF